MRVGIVMGSQSDLLEVAGTLNACRSFAYFLDCRQQQSHKNADDGENHEQFDQGKPGAASGTNHASNLFKVWKQNGPKDRDRHALFQNQKGQATDTLDVELSG